MLAPAEVVSQVQEETNNASVTVSREESDLSPEAVVVTSTNA